MDKPIRFGGSRPTSVVMGPLYVPIPYTKK